MATSEIIDNALIYAPSETTEMIIGGVTFRGTYAGAVRPSGKIQNSPAAVDDPVSNTRIFVSGVAAGFKNVSVTGIVSQDNGIGIRVDSSPLVVVQESTFSGNTCTYNYGGGIYDNADTMELIRVKFIGNSANHSGGAVYQKTGNLTVTDSLFDRNAAVYYAGAIYNNGGVLDISGSTFSGNTSGRRGGAVQIENGSSAVANSLFVGNAALGTDGNGGAGAINYDTSGPHTISGSTFSGNTTNYYGGAVNLNYGNVILSVSGSTFAGNYSKNCGGAINQKCGLLTLENSLLEGNHSTYHGGAVNLSGGTFSVSGSTFSANVSDSRGGGGVNQTGGRLALSSSLFRGNVAVPNNSDAMGGAIIFGAAGLQTVTGSTFSGNVSKYYGGAVTVKSAADNLQITGTTFSGNMAGKFGGALDNNGITGISQSVFSGNSASSSGGAIYEAAGTLTLQNSLVSGNLASSYGGAAHTAGGLLDITGTTFTGNSAGHSGGAFYVTGGTTKLAGSLVAGNYGKYYGGAVLQTGGVLNISGSTFSGNVADQRAGGVICQNGGQLTVSSSLFKDNENHQTSGDGLGGAILFSTAGTQTIAGSTFAGNVSGYAGGAVSAAVSGTVLNITGTTFSNNSARNYGGAVNAGGASLSFSESVISGNSAGHSGGAFYLTGGTLTLENSVVAGNKAVYYGGAGNVAGGLLALSATTISGNSAARVGAVYIGGGTLNVNGGGFDGNFNTDATADGLGGALVINAAGTHTVANALFSGNTAAGSGGALSLLNAAELTLTGVTFSGNTARNFGGAVNQSSGTLTVNNAFFTANAATNYYGGAAYVTGGAMNITGTTFSGNTAGRVGGIYVAGGALSVNGSLFDGNRNTVGNADSLSGALAFNAAGTHTVTNTVFRNNYSKYYGGALYNNSAALTVTGCTFADNYARNHGGAIAMLNGTLTVADSLFDGNSVTDYYGSAIYVGGGSASVSGSTFSGNSGPNGAIYVASGAVLSLSGITLAGTSDQVLNDGTLTISGSNMVNSSINGSENSSLVISGASFTFGNGTDVDFAAFTGTVAGLAFTGGAQVNFTGADFSGLGNITVANEALATQCAVWTIASGAAFADNQTITVNDVSAQVNGDSFKIGENAEYLLKYDVADGLRLEALQPESQPFTAFSTAWTSESYPETITVAGTEYQLSWGVNAFNSGADALSVLASDGIIAAVDGAMGIGAFYTGGRDLYVLGNNHVLSTDDLGTIVSGGTVGSALVVVENVRRTKLYINGLSNSTAKIAGDSTVKITGSTFDDHVFLAGSVITGDLNVTVENSLVTPGKSLYLCGYAKGIGGVLSANVSGSTVGSLAFLAQDTTSFTMAGETVNISDSIVQTVKLGNRANVTVSGEMVLNLTDSVVNGSISVASATANNGRIINVAGNVSVNDNILDTDTLTVNSGANLIFSGSTVSGGTSTVKLVNNGTITVNGTCAAGTTYFSFYDRSSGDAPGTLTSANGGGVYTAADKLYYYNGLYVDSALAEAAVGTEVGIVVGGETVTALYGVNAFRSSTAARTADAKATLTILNETFANNFYGNGTTIFAGGTVAKTTYGGQLMKASGAAGDSSLTITGGTFASMVVGGNRVSVDSGDVAVTAGTASLMVTGGEFNADKSYLAAAGYLINKGTSATLTVSEANLTLAGSDVVLKKYAFGGAFADNGTATMSAVNVSVSAGKYESVFAGGWAQNNGTVKVTGATVNISGGSIRNLYAGGTDSGDGNTTNTATAVLNISGGSVRNVFLNGKYSRDTVTTATLNVTDECEINWIEGLSHSMKGTGAGTTLNIKSSFTVEDILHVKNWNFDFGKEVTFADGHTADLDGTKEEALTSVLNFQVAAGSSFTEDWVALTASAIEGLTKETVLVNGIGADSFANNIWSFADTAAAAYQVEYFAKYKDTNDAALVVKKLS